MLNDCADYQTSQDAYLDAELQDAEVREFESHLGNCEDCQNSFERAEQEHKALRSHLRAIPPASDFLNKKIMTALDAEDSRTRRENRLRWFSIPTVASATAAAALLLFAWTTFLPTGSAEIAVAHSSQVTQDVARQHLREAPLFVSNDRGDVGRGAADFLNTPVRAPQFSSQAVKLLGWTPAQLGGKQSATFVYEVTDQTGRHKVHAHAVALEDIDLRSQSRLVIHGAELWIDEAYGFNTVTYHPKNRRLAYVFSSDMSVNALVAMVTRTDTVNSLVP
ncbi:MAG: zf-HC2 domain-containing protein [Myxococcales bacterium]|nr:zf-HC2 domain-containing protein [Myxococcales bacterium]